MNLVLSWIPFSASIEPVILHVCFVNNISFLTCNGNVSYYIHLPLMTFDMIFQSFGLVLWEHEITYEL